MGVKVSLIVAVLFILLDLILTTVLFTQGSHWSVFREEALNFDLLSSVLDLWGCVLLRGPLLLGACIGVSWNKQDGPPRVSTLSTPVLLLCLVIITFALAKMLMLSEQEPLTQPWCLSLICWTCVSSLLVVLIWNQIGKKEAGKSPDRSSRRGCELVGRAEVESESKKEEEEMKSGSGATLGRLLSYCRKDGGLMSVAVLFLLISAVCEAFIPYYYGKAIDSIVVHQSMEYFAKPVITLSALALVSSLAMGEPSLQDADEAGNRLFDENHTGDIISRLSADTTQVSDLISNNINVFLRSIVKGVGFFIFMFGMSWKLTLVTIMGFPFIAVVSKLYGDYYKKLTKEVQTTLAEANKVAEETISSMRTVRSFANEEGEADTYLSKLLVMFQLNKKQALAYAGYMWSSCISELALEIAVLYYGGHLVVSGQMSSGSLISESERQRKCLNIWTGNPNTGLTAPRLRTPARVWWSSKTSRLHTRHAPIPIFSRGCRSCYVPARVTAIVGPSGSGKSSCVSLLENFYRPQRGEVLLDGKPVHTYQHDYLHSKIGLVGQEPVLFARTVEENITYGLSDVSMEAVEQAAATKANAHEFISCLPTGYQTSVGERKAPSCRGGQKNRGWPLQESAGQKPSSPHPGRGQPALWTADSEPHRADGSEQHHAGPTTVLVIAHRLSSGGEGGTTSSSSRAAARLMASEGLYFKLVQRQFWASTRGP
ncbi:hypothetical protein KUCAC02_029030, partial [Chaenocephalus aceratus]